MPSPSATIAHMHPADAIDLPDTLESYQVIFSEEDGPLIALGIDPDTARQTLIWHSPLPSKIIVVGDGFEMPGARGTHMAAV